MRKILSVALICAFVVAYMPGGLFAAEKRRQQSGTAVATQTGSITGTARGADQQPLPNYTVRARSVANGQIAGSTTSSGTGEFSFTGLAPGEYVIEIVDSRGRIVGLSPSISVRAGASVNVIVSATAAGSLTGAGGGGFSLFGLGPLATVAVVGAAGAAGVVAVVQVREGKIVMCHNGQTITISESAKDAHLAQGDTLGACPASGSR